MTFLWGLSLQRALLLLSVMAVSLTSTQTQDCPENCVCKWKSGKETTECINRDKDAIPAGIAPSTQVLDLRGNNIRVLHNNIFLQLGITNLQRVYCSYCSIVEVEPRAFRRLTNLVELDLSENSMREVPSEAWRHTKALMRLNLSGNPIKLIRSGAFKRLEFVTTLALSHCDIETLEDGAFEGMVALTEVRLESNRLQYLQGSGLFPHNLNHIEIHDNPFRCDCRLLDFTHWLQRSGVPRPVEPACKTPPRLENRTLAALSLEELACLPQVEPAASVTEAVATSNVSLKCSAFGLPSASVSWWHSNRLVANGSELTHAWEDQYFAISEYRTNAHQLVSEFVILAIRPEDEGSFFCSAQNSAGVARANFTVRVVESLTEGGGGAASLPDNSNSPPAGGSPGGLQENTNLLNKGDADMFKVEYILGFGAAAVIVLTIIIVLVLYLILQCRSQRRKRRAARAAGLHCDSASNSYMERSTVDFIVPGEMELTSAVRSVSCSSTINKKCNGTASGTKDNAASKERDGCGSGNDGDDEEEYGTTTSKNNLAASGIKKSTIYTNNWQQPPPPQPQNGCPPRPTGPPSYRPPPLYGGGCQRNASALCPCCGEPQQNHQGHQQQPHHPGPQQWAAGGQAFPFNPHGHGQVPPPGQGVVPGVQPGGVPGMNPGIQGLNHPAYQVMTMPARMCHQPVPAPRPGLRPQVFQAANGQFFQPAMNLTLPPNLRPFIFQQPMIQGGPGAPQGGGGPHLATVSGGPWPPPGIPGQMPGILKGAVNAPSWLDGSNLSTESGDTEDAKYGPYSDGEADRGFHMPHNRRQARSRSLPRRPASSLTYNTQAPPGHQNFVSLSRTAMVGQQRVEQRFEQIQYRGPQMQRTGVRYSSQPQLNGSLVLDFGGPLMPGGGGGAPGRGGKPPVPPLKPQLSLRGNPASGGGAPGGGRAKAPPKVPPKYQRPVSQQGPGAVMDADYLFPDLPPPPDTLLSNSNGNTSNNNNNSTSDSPPNLNSRSSSLDDLNWVTSAADMSRQVRHPPAGGPGFHRPSRQPHKSNTLPNQPIGIMKKRYSGSGSGSQNNTPEGGPPGGAGSRRGSGAIRVDLSTADKTIRRRPGSEPDLVANSPTKKGLLRQPSTENQHGGGFKRVSRSMSNDRGSSMSGSKKVMFSGVSDGEESSPTEDDSPRKPPAGGEDVWVLRQETQPRKPESRNLVEEDDGIPVTGVIVAQPQPCKYMMAQLAMQQKMQQQQQQQLQQKMLQPLSQHHQAGGMQPPHQTMPPNLIQPGQHPHPMQHIQPQPLAMVQQPQPQPTMQPIYQTTQQAMQPLQPLQPLPAAHQPLHPPVVQSLAAAQQPQLQSVQSTPQQRQPQHQPPPPPPPRTTPISTGATAATVNKLTSASSGQQQQQQPSGSNGSAGAANGATGTRAPNPVLQRPGMPQFHESPDEGYHEDDAGSEVL